MTMIKRKEKATDKMPITNSTNREYLSNLEAILSTAAASTREEPVSRSDLAWVINATDREVRKYINDLRERGYRICMTTTGGGGYWLAQSEKDYQDFRREYVSYARNIEKMAKAMDNGPMEGQVIMDE